MVTFLLGPVEVKEFERNADERRKSHVLES
jgi:hypothetical protein